MLLAPFLFAAALLYSSVGHAGASAYLAIMALAGVTPAVMKPTALALNILVASIGTIRFARAGFFSWRTFAPFAVTSVPAAFLGGAITLPTHVYRWVVAAVLLLAAYRLFRPAAAPAGPAAGGPPLGPALILGGVIGILSGVTGVGGGIFLSPLLLLTGWAEMRRTAGVSAAFILVNSLAGIGGHLSTVGALPSFTYLWGAAVVLGGLIGSELGTRRLNVTTLRYLLGTVLVVGSVKLLLG